MFRLLKRMKKKDWLLLGLIAVLTVLQVWLDLKLPDYMSRITILVETDGSTMSEVLQAGGKMLLCALGSLAFAAAGAFAIAYMSSDFSADLRHQLFQKVQSFSMAEIEHFSIDSLITRTTNDVQQIQMFIVMGIQALIKAPVMAVWAILKIYDKSWEWTAATAVGVVILMGLIVMLVLIAMPKYKKLQAYTDDLNRVTRENLTGVNVVRAYNAEKYQEDKSEKANQNLTKANLFAFRTISFLFPSIQLVMNGLTLAIYWIGAVLIEKAAIGMKLTLFSDMVVFSSYAMQILMSFILLTAIMIILPRASVSAHRINEVLDTKASILDGKGVEVKEEEKGTVEFRDVSFRYPGGGGNVLEHISFKAEKGQTVAFIGATGCGKTTLINLIPRFYDVTEGQVLVDGKDVRDYKQEDLRDRIGYVAQKAVLFSGDVASNVGYAYDEALADEQVDRAVRIAQASDFVSGPEGRQKYVAQGGSNFSGGQKQRLSIARAVAKDPEIYIFDDSFSALDYRTDRAVRSALKKECHDATRLIVAQRIGTIRDADLIIVLADGKAVGQGTHEELMKNCAEYQAIASSQLSAKELAA